MRDAPGLCGVSRETRAALEAYVDLLVHWNRRINLVGRGTVDDIWRRHIADSAQLADLAPLAAAWCDIGSGGGLPAVVLSILARGRGAPMQMTCIESDHRKATFLRTVAREIDLSLKVVVSRAEAAQPLEARVVCARAVAPLQQLLGHAERHLEPGGICLFPKGRTWRDELEAACGPWHFSVDAVPSATDREAVILVLGDISRA